jgi:hypothetical protein
MKYQRLRRDLPKPAGSGISVDKMRLAAEW